MGKIINYPYKAREFDKGGAVEYIVFHPSTRRVVFATDQAHLYKHIEIVTMSLLSKGGCLYKRELNFKAHPEVE